MESEKKLPPKDLVKCCNCSCTTCALVDAPSNSWFRSVKRKYDEFETGNKFYVPGLDLYSNARVQIENECSALRETVSSQQATIQGLYSELEEERSASSSAATEAMSMILKLQSEKAEIEMDSRQFKRFAEEKMSHDQDEIVVLEDLLYKREQTVQALTCEAQAYKHRMLSYGFTEAEVEGEKDGQMWHPSVTENFDAEVDLPAYDYPPLKCNLNENPGNDVEDVEDVEKYTFGETPHSQEHLRNLEERISQMERNPSSSQLDGEIPGTRNVFEKVVVGHSPRRPRHSRRLSTDSSTNSFFSREMGSEFISDSPRYNTNFKKMELVSEMDEISSTRRMDNVSEVRDDMSDRVYIIDSVHNGVSYKGTVEQKNGLGISDNYASTPRETFNLPDVCDPDIKKLYMRLQNLEADRESMRQALLSMRTDKAQLVFLEASSSYLYGLSPNNVGLLMLLDRGPRLGQWRCLSSTQSVKRM